MITEEVHISRIKIGDTIIHDGFVKTVCKRVLKYSSFMGSTLYGDSYQLGHKLVKRINYGKN